MAIKQPHNIINYNSISKPKQRYNSLMVLPWLCNRYDGLVPSLLKLFCTGEERHPYDDSQTPQRMNNFRDEPVRLVWSKCQYPHPEIRYNINKERKTLKPMLAVDPGLTATAVHGQYISGNEKNSTLTSIHTYV